jgi:hypothetical protein
LSEIPIDGIWVSSDVEVLSCTYGAFEAGNDGADQRVLWMDVDLHSFLVTTTPSDYIKKFLAVFTLTIPNWLQDTFISSKMPIGQRLVFHD